MKKYFCAAACALFLISTLNRPAQGQDLTPGTWQVLMINPEGQILEAEYIVRVVGRTTTAAINWRSSEVAVSDLRVDGDALSFSWDPYFPMDCRFEREPDGQFMGGCMDRNEDIGPVLLSPPGTPIDYDEVNLDKALEVWDISREEYMAARQSYPQTRSISYEEIEPVPAKIVSVEGRRTNIAVAGEGKVTVVLESEIGDDHTVWQRVQSTLSDGARVVAYDRPGLGMSDPNDAQKTPRQHADELRALLSAADLDAPYVLVGHGAAAFTLRSFIEVYPDDVAGVVLINPSHEREDDIWSTLDEESWTAYVERKRSFLNTLSTTAGDEFDAYIDALATWDDRPTLAGRKMPSVVVSGLRPVERPNWVGETPQGLKVRESLHRSLAGELGAEVVQANESGTYVHLDAPGVVVDAIEDVLSTVEKSR